MNKEKLNKLQEVINDQLDLIEMNVARINNKDYFGLDFELLKYIRNLENQLDIANKKLDKIKEYADDKREEFNEVIRYYLDDNLIGNEDEVNKLREFRSWFMEILSILGGE